MRFYDGKDPKEILGGYESRPINKFQDSDSDYLFVVKKYLDGRSDGSYENKSILKELDDKLLELAKKRDEETFVDTRFAFDKDLMIFLLTAPVAIAGAMTGVWTIFVIAGLISLHYGSKLPKELSKLNELKKYRLYISMMDELAKDENKNILDVIEFEKLYQVPLSINTLDRYSYGDMKVLKKELKRRNDEKEKIHTGFQFEIGKQ